MVTICLNMIVRDEAEVIVDTLANITDNVNISTWVIHDTGSQDNTPELIKGFFARLGIPGELIQRKWENFGANRQHALKDAQDRADFALFFDADSRIEGEFPSIPGDADAYMLNVRRGSTVYPVKMLVRNDGRYRWRGVVHEGLYFNGQGEKPAVRLEGNYVVHNRSAGARSRDPSTYYRDATTLVREIENIKDEDRDLLPRYTFYAANSWRDAHVPREAAEWYRKRIALGGWRDEVYLSHLGLGIELKKLGDHDGAISAWLIGQGVCPDRAECLYQLAWCFRLMGNYHIALLFAQAGQQCQVPDGGRLLVWRDVYAFWLDFEYLSSLKALGRLQEGDDAVARMRERAAPAHLFEILGV